MTKCITSSDSCVTREQTGRKLCPCREQITISPPPHPTPKKFKLFYVWVSFASGLAFTLQSQQSSRSYATKRRHSLRWSRAPPHDFMTSPKAPKDVCVAASQVRVTQDLVCTPKSIILHTLSMESFRTFDYVSWA